jgi:hypothetical protein
MIITSLKLAFNGLTAELANLLLGLLLIVFNESKCAEKY